MNTKAVIKELQKKYPGNIIIENKNSSGIATEIICEIVKPTDTTEKSFAIAVIDSSVLHYHKKITEVYKVIKGILKIFKFDSDTKEYKEFIINKGDSITIKPGEIHTNLGNETWVEVTSTPAWHIEDFYNLENILKEYITTGS